MRAFDFALYAVRADIIILLLATGHRISLPGALSREADSCRVISSSPDRR